MSLLSPDRLTLWLAPEEVQAVHVRSSGRITALRNLPLIGDGDWSETLEACRLLIEECRPSQVRVVVSDRLVRYLVQVWNPQVQGPAEELALAQIQFEDTYGEQSASDWTFSISNERPGVNRLVCAVPRVLLDGVQQLAVAQRARLQSFQPNLVAVMAGLQRDLGAQGWFINMEGGRLTLLHWAASGIDWVASGRCAPRSLQSALTVLRREMLLCSGAHPDAGDKAQVLLVNPLLNLASVPPESDLQIEVAGLGARTLERLRRLPVELIAAESDLDNFRAVLMGAQL